MVKSELVTALSKRQPHLLVQDIELAVNCMLEQMSLTLIAGERIEIRDFGSFSIRERPPRIGRNPKTGKAVPLPAKLAIHFKPGKAMKDRVNASRDHYAIQE